MALAAKLVPWHEPILVALTLLVAKPPCCLQLAQRLLTAPGTSRRRGDYLKSAASLASFSSAIRNFLRSALGVAMI